MSTLRGRLIGVFLTVVLVALGGLGYTAFTLSREALMDLGKKEGVALAKGVAVEKQQIELPVPIKTLGPAKVVVKVMANLHADLKVDVVAE